MVVDAPPRCACSQPMVRVPNDNAWACPHCDQPCEIRNCVRCGMFQVGSRKKGLAGWTPPVLP